MCIGLPGRVTEVDGEQAVIDVAGISRRVSISLLVLEGAQVEPGDWILASAGLAVQCLSEKEAHELLESLGG
ncbi:MAG TPA: HypC/HybG/HupF family hydrogenase formation chaperone [Jiangellaceae bacterium]